MKGVQVLEGTMNEEGNIPQFIKDYKPGFPVGAVDRVIAGGYMQLSPVVRPFVPFMLFIDRNGMIQAQYTGGEDFLKNEETQEKNIRGELDKLLASRKTAKAAKTHK